MGLCVVILKKFKIPEIFKLKNIKYERENEIERTPSIIRIRVVRVVSNGVIS